MLTKSWGSLFLRLSFVLVVVSYLAFIHFRGIIFSDEGYILNSGWRVLLGQVPYRDFDIVYTPVSFLAVSGVFKVLGTSVFSGRVLMLLLSTLTFGFVAKTVKEFSKLPGLGLLAGIVYLVWGPGQINFPWPTMFAITMAVLTTFLLVRKKNNAKHIFLAGVLGMTAFLSKQNLGAGLLVVDTGILIFLYRKKAAFFIIGAWLLFFAWLVYLFLNGAVISFFENLYFHTFQKIVVEGTISTPFITSTGSFLTTFLKTIFYCLPALVGFLAIFSCMNKSRRHLLPIPIFGLVFYFFGIRPVTDYNHFVPLLSISGLSLAIITSYYPNKLVKIGSLLLLGFLGIFGLYRSLYGNYYRWGQPLVKQNSYVAHQRVKIWVTTDDAIQTNSLSRYFETNSTPTDKIFVNIYLPMVYFLTNRQNATRFDYFSDSAISRSQQNNMVTDLERGKTQFVVGNRLNLNGRSKIHEYLQANFEKMVEFGTYVIFKRVRNF